MKIQGQQVHSLTVIVTPTDKVGAVDGGNSSTIYHDIHPDPSDPIAKEGGDNPGYLTRSKLQPKFICGLEPPPNIPIQH